MSSKKYLIKKDAFIVKNLETSPIVGEKL